MKVTTICKRERPATPTLAAIHGAIDDDKRRQFARRAAGRYAWDSRMPAPAKVRKELSRQQRRREGLEAFKEEQAYHRRRAAELAEDARAKREVAKRAAAFEMEREAAGLPPASELSSEELARAMKGQAFVSLARQQGKTAALAAITNNKPQGTD